MKKILVGLVLLVFCLSLTSAFAIKRRDRAPATGIRPSVSRRIELPSGYHVLIFSIQLKGDWGEEAGEVVSYIEPDSMQIRIIGDDYNFVTITPDLTRTGRGGHLYLYTKILKTGSYRYSISATIIETSTGARSRVADSGTILLDSNKTVSIDWTSPASTPHLRPKEIFRR